MDGLENKLNHLAIIMDGNSRWAAANNLTRNLGHKQGAQRAKDAIQWAIQLGVKHLSLFAFSTENWQRPEPEVQYLLDLFDWYLTGELTNLVKNGVKLQIVGNLETLSQALRAKVENINNLIPQTLAINVYIAFSYGGRQELVAAVKKAIANNIQPEEVNEQSFTQLLYVPEMPEIDLLIRTGGNRRMSNFFLWHSAYAELYFIDKYWPDFTKQHMQEAIDEYKSCLRTFGVRK